MSQKPEISFQALLEDLDGDEELLETILEDFSREYGALQETLRKALDDRDFPLASRTAHSMKSGLGMLGWHEGVVMADGIHRLCHGGDVQGARKAMEGFDPGLSEVLCQIRRKLPDRHASSGESS
jgi:HPt (histidine-containing phosphotransfer) domain-containing protein